MGAGTILILIIIAIVVFSYFGTQLTAFAKDYQNIFSQIVRDDRVKVPTPSNGVQVHDLVVTTNIRWESVFGTDVLFLNGNGGTVSYQWENPHLFRNSWIDMSMLSIFGKATELQQADILVPIPNITGAEGTLSFILVDTQTHLQIKIPEYQNVPFKIPPGVGQYQIIQKLNFKDIIKKDYELWIIPSGDGAFNEHTDAEAYKQKIQG